MPCPRCQGLFIQDQSWNPYETAPMLPIWRCLNCGEILDEGIQRNRRHPVPPVRSRSAGNTRAA